LRQAKEIAKRVMLIPPSPKLPRPQAPTANPSIWLLLARNPALEMIHVAFREQAALTPEEEEKFKKVA
jgi:hypothetical protein